MVAVELPKQQASISEDNTTPTMEMIVLPFTEVRIELLGDEDAHSVLLVRPVQLPFVPAVELINTNALLQRVVVARSSLLLPGLHGLLF